MVIHELIPRCQRLGLGRPPYRIGTMGGYGAILFAEKYPHLIAAVAAISPAIWTSYSQANGANSGAYASAGDFAADDAVTHADALAGIPVWVASGYSDPFRPGVESLAKVPTSIGRHELLHRVSYEPVLRGRGASLTWVPGSASDRLGVLRRRQVRSRHPTAATCQAAAVKAVSVRWPHPVCSS